MKDHEPLAVTRLEIDRIDHDLLQLIGGVVGLLGERVRLVDEVAAIKAQTGDATHQPERFQAMLDSLCAQGQTLGIKPELIQDVWNAIHDHSLAQQNSAKISS